MRPIRNSPRRGSESAGVALINSPLGAVELGSESHVLMAIQAGALTFEWQGGIDHAGPGDLLMLRQGERIPAWQHGQEPLQTQMVMVPPDMVEHFERRYGDDVARLLRERTQRHVRVAWELLLESRRRECPHVLREHLLQYLLLVLASEGALPGFLTCSQMSLVQRVERIFNTDLIREWRLGDVAAQLKMSEITVRRKLGHEGTTFRAVLEGVRMSRALHEVLYTQHPVRDISYRCGYGCPSRFTNRFKARYGLTPRHLRGAA